MSEMNGSRERITLLDRPVPSVIGRLTASTERVLASDGEAAGAARQLDTLLGRLVLAQLCAMGLFATARGSIRRWKQQVGLSPLYARWLDETLRVLAHRGELEVEGDLCAIREATGGERHETVPWFDWDDFRRTWSRDRDLRAQLNLADATLRALPAILSGREQAIHVLFPDASMVLVESVYKHNAVADHFHAVLADTVVAYVRERLARDAGARLRILEIGAGTGGTTEGVLARLEPHAGAIAEYCYTDVSHAFLLHGEQVYGPKARYLTCKRFHVEESPQAQGIAIGAYDVVIAANVLHATKQIRRTLRHAKATLRRNGILVLHEIAAPGMFTHLTFGLLEGWWLYEDAALRIPGTPALSGETWRRVLEGEGFSSVVFPAEATYDRGHQILVAESDGLVRHAPPRATQAERVIAPEPASERPRGVVVVDARGDQRASAEERGELDGTAGAARAHGPRGVDVVRERASVALRKLLADTIRTPLNRIDATRALETYGVDSLLVVKLTRGLRAFFPALSSTLFFEHRTLAGVVDFLIETEEAAVRAWVGLARGPEPAAALVPTSRPDAPVSRDDAPVHHVNGHAPAVVTAPARAQVATPAAAAHDGVAIIGMSGRYPGARDVRQYWANLKAGRSSIREIPAERWDHRRYYDPQKGVPGKSYSKWGGFIEDIDTFDPLFFRISPREAELMDPQERLFLEEAYASIEDAGYTPARLCASRKVGVYVGVMNSTYQRHAAYWSIANRVSYLFDFHGPSMAVDTACSSSLTAIHLAVEAIRHGACEMAIAGGVHLIVDPVQYANLSAATMLSTGDRCKAFGAGADGFVDGEGVGSLVLKSLGQAIADGDPIYGVIRGSAVNAGGKTHGYTVPNPAAQRDVVQAALRAANVDARAVSYVEAHGTGTELGDPIEIAGLTQAFAAQTGERQYCAIGSVKSNIGHLESAAGIAAVTKVLLQLQAKTLVPSLHAEELNPHIDFTRTPFRVQQAVSEWQRPVVVVDGEARAYPRIAGVSSFGAGGGNAHVVIEEHIAEHREAARPAASPARHPAMIVLSARTDAQLVAQAQRLQAHVASGERAGELTDIAYTLQVGREAMDHRLAFTAASLAELHDKLGAFVAGRALDDGHRGQARTAQDVLGALIEEGDLEEAIDRWIQRGTYGKLLGLWARGAAVDWARLYRDGAPLADVAPRRVRLPSYAFARERYWLDRSAVLDAAAESVARPTSEAAALKAPSAQSAQSAQSASRAQSASSAQSAPSESSDGLRGCIALVPRWEPVTPRSSGAWPEAGARVLWVNPAPAHREEPAAPPLVLAVDDDPSIETIAARIRSLGEVDHVVWRAPASADAESEAESIEAQTAGVIGLYRLIKALLSLGHGTRVLGLTVLTQEAHAVRPEDRVCAAHASVHGLIGSLAKEQPRWKVRLVDLGRESDAAAEVWRSLPPDPRGRAWAHRDGIWHEQQLVPLLDTGTPSPAYRQHGVYVVIGGAGHVGMAWSEWVISRYQAQVIWLGRRPQDAAIAARIARLADLGRAPHYLVADAADLESLQNACREIKQAHGRIDGVVLSSAVLEPRAIQDLPEDQLRASLRAKVDVSVRVAQVFADEPLDFVLFFSSLITFIKNPLQGHYAAGCSFADAFARRWAQRAPAVKVINWGYWDKAGLSGLAEVEQLTRAGIGRIEAPEGMAALDALIAGPLGQVGLIKLTRPLAIEGVNADEIIRVVADGPPEDRPVDAARLAARMQVALAGRHADIARRVAAQAARAGQRERLEDLLAALLVVQLGKLGLFQAGATSLEAEQRRLDARYGRWLAETVRALGRQGYLRADRAGLSVTRWPDEQAAWQAWQAAGPELSADADLRAGIQLLGSTLPALPDILRGTRPVTDVLFQGAAMTQVEGIYRGNPRADYFNAVVAEAVVAYLEDRRASASRPAPLRILEIGAGTGATSAAVFERLDAHRDLVAEYCYTDLSPAFLRHAESQYAARHPYLTCQRFDVERPPGEQGIAVGAYDLVIATNVLHATRRIRHTVRNAKAALRRHGVLLLNEMNRHSSGLLVHLTFGLTTGWWLFEDEALRIPGTPGVSPETWRSVLASEGFSGIGFPARAGHELGQQVVLAHSDGVVQQPVTRTTAASAPRAARAVAASAAPPATPSGESQAGAIADGRAELVRTAVLDVLCSALKLPRGKVDEAASFADYGMDSIVGVGFVEALNRRLALDLETTVIFDHSSVARLAELIVSRHGEALAVHVPDGAPAELDPPAPPPTVTEAGAEVRSEPAVAERPARPSGKEPIAIVGIAGRFAQSTTPEELWQHLANGDDLVGAVERWDLRALYAERGLPEGCRSGSFLARLDEFDPLFFHISGTEATFMDPQQRIFLEEAWKALEDAGYAGPALSGRACGVYVGCMTGDYAEHCKRQAPAQAMWGNAASIIPARISYYLNLQGPAIAIDSACSSSLVAMHLACQALWAHEIELALAGGVSVQTTPGFYLQASNAGMLSSTGRCHTFDDRADGFVPGEGAGVVVLKRLSDALAAGDHIHAVIRGSGINQDGTTNGITAPSALSQERVERDVYQSFGIHPEEIQLVEAHGTGTRLGDPIEFRALRSSFGASTRKTAYCALGSIKTNIGHTLLAAGVAGVLKLVMALKHRQIPPSLHFERGNLQIDFESSPFFVNTTLRAWEVPAGQKRRAAVSSFGFSGTNAHMVIEEAPDAARAPAIRPGHLVVLSARTAAQLTEQVTRLVRHCEDHGGIHCGDVSYTLLLGRRHLAHRLACVARDVEGLVSALRAWLDHGKAAQVFAAVVDDDGHEQAPLVQYGNQCIEACRAERADARHLEHLAMLASLYTQGYRLRYDRLFAGEPYARISLPTYPFARDRYWPEDAHRALPAAGAAARPDALHPLLHRNTSTLAEQRFTTRLGTRAGGDEFFLDQHIVQGNKVLPGVAYLEMARAAVAASVDAGLQGSVVLEDIVWLRPVIGSGDTEVHIRLRSAAEDAPRGAARVDFEIYSGADAAAGLHAQGRAMVVDTGPAARVELAALRSRCTRSIAVDTCYATFHAMGIDHGPAYRGLTSLHVGESDGRRFVLARVELPACVAGTASQYVLHPSVMDSVLQSAVGLLLTGPDGRADLARPMLPFGLDRLEICQPCPAAAWVVLRTSAAHGPRGAEGIGARSESSREIDKVDIDVIDDAGAVCLRMIGFTSRVLPPELDGDHTLLLTPRWVDRPLVQDAPGDVARTVLLDARYQARLAELASRWPAVTWSVLAEPDPEADRMVAVGEQVFSHVQSRLGAEPGRPALLQVILAAGGDAPAISRGVGALLKTAAQEDPAFAGQVLALPGAASAAEIAQVSEDNARSSAPLEIEIRYLEGVRQALVWQTAAALREGARAAAPWKDGGVYWITGGAGGLGRIFAREIAARTQGATIVLSGRSALDDARRAELAACAQNGARVEYRAVDVTDRRAVTEFVQALVRERGGLHGIVHSAGVIRDGFVVRKDVRDVREVLAPKVLGTCHLDDATRELDLEFLLLFSSASAVLGNVGQADYAMANAFMDGHAARRDEWQRASGRSGRTLAINWPLWADGGMRVSGALEAEMRRQGFAYLDTAAAMAALDRAWASGAAQVAILAGDRGKLRQRVGLGAGLREPLVSAAAPAGAEDRALPTVVVDAGDLRTRVQGALAAMIARDLKIAIDEIQPNHELTALGFDSVGFTVFSKALNGLYGLALRPTVFFEYPTLRGFAEHLVAQYGPQLAGKLAVPAAAGPTRAAPRVDAAPERRASPIDARAGSARSRAGVVPHAGRPAAHDDDPIAIVGMSGCFPGSDGVDAFWQSLAAERDCIVEVPASRWDWHAIYGDPTQETNKTNVKWGGFMAGVDEFDPLFFGIAPAEAELMDPAQRLLMTHTWKVIEDAGYSARSLSGTRTGIFVGTGTTGYTELIAQSGVPIEGHSATGAVASLGPNRMSYLLNLHGPSEPIETACSSSLVAIHRALRAMQSGDCEMALVGGVNVIPTPWAHISFSRAGMLCEDGRCKTFSKHANGYVRGEGVGMLFLKKLSAAERDGDHIYAVIRGSAENHGGRASSLTAPNPRAQAEVIQAAHREAGVDPRTVSYVETHGTGTALGDPIEIDGLKRVFGELPRDAAPDAAPAGEAYCGLGSVKTNIGHLELAAGVAGVIKVVMQLRHRTLVKSLHCDEVNPYIDLAGSPFYLVRQTQAWNAPHDRDGRALPRRAGVSSFGFGGVNAHVVLEEYRGPQAPPAAARAVDRPAIIVLSAKNRDRLRDHAQQLLAHLAAQGGAHACTPEDLASIAYTLQVGREAMEHRLALVANDGSELCAKLAAYLEGAGRGEPDGVWSGQVRRDKDALAVFDADDDLQEAVASWLRKGKYARLLALWVKGLAVDWHLLYGDAHPPRVPLPTYPFAKERYWIGRAEAGSAGQAPVSAQAMVSAAQATVPAGQATTVRAGQAAVPAGQAAVSAAAPAPRWLKVAERWTVAPLFPRPRSRREPGPAGQRVLVLYRHDEDAVGIRRALADVWAGDARDLQVDALQLPGGASGAAPLPLDGYLAAHRAPDMVLWFSGAFADPARELAGVLCAIQSLRSRAAGQTLQFLYCYPYTGSEEQIHQEGLSGLFRAAALEWPAHGYRTLEYPAGGAPASYAAIAREWAASSTANDVFGQVPMVRYRDGERQVTRLVELAGPEPVAAPVTLRRGGTYLLVGALGEVGRSLCLALARSHAPRLVILSRRPDDAELRRQLQPILDAGAQVIYRAVDVTDEERLAQTLAALKLQVGPIHGVFHLARAVDDGPLTAKRVEAFERTIAAKVRGTLCVDKLTAGEPLDFFLAFSSMAAFGIEGSADYGYATAFQNAFVRDRNLRVARGQRAGQSLAVCWGQWCVDAYASEQRLAQIKRLGFDLIEASEAVPLIEAALRDRAEVVGIMAVHDAKQVRQLYGLAQAPDERRGVAAGGSPDRTAGEAQGHASRGIEPAPALARLLEEGLERDPELERVRRALLAQTPEQLAALYASLTNGAGQESSWSQKG